MTTLLTSLLLLLAFIGYAQEHSYMHLEVRDGLAGATVYCIAQDQDGFMWFGTETGLSRYDGTAFRNYTTFDGLPDNEIIKIFIDSRNRIWLIPFKKSVAYIWHGKIHNMHNDSILSHLPIRSELLNIIEDRKGNILFQQSKDLCIMNVAGNVTRIDSFRSEESADFHMAGSNNQGDFRVGVYFKDKLWLANIEGNKLVYNEDRKIGQKGRFADYLGPGLDILEGRDSLLSIFYKHRHYNIFRPKGFISLSRINDSLITLNTYTNSLLFNLACHKVVETFLEGQTVNAVKEDSEGNYWFSTLGNGVFRMGSKEIKNYFFKRGNNDQAIFCIKKIDSILYFGGDHFLLGKIDDRTGGVKTSQICDAITRGRILDLVKGYDRKLIVASDNGCLWVSKFGAPAKWDTMRTSIKSIQNIDDSLILFTTNIFTRVFRRKDLSFKKKINDSRGTCSYRSTQGVIYIGQMDGLNIIEANGRSWYPGDQEKLLSNMVTAIKEAADGTIWTSLDGGGIVGLRNGKVIGKISEDDGLTSNICRSLFLTGNAIWVGTDKGLNKIVLTERGYRVIPYTTSDGLGSDMVNAVYVKGNDVYVGTSRGLTSFNDNKLSKSSQCILRLTGISVSEKPLSEDSTDFELTHRNNNIRFDFVGISYKSAGGILYKYRLLGLDTSWKYTRETFLSYPSLPSGEYALQLSAINKFGVWSRQAIVRFKVSPPVWERWWFRLLLLLAIGFLIFLMFVARVRWVRKKEMDKVGTSMKIAELEQMALRSQMNPHFIFNCLNSIQQYVISRDVIGANEFITKFSFLIRQTLNFSTRTHISLEEEIGYITVYLELEKKRVDHRFKYEIRVGENIDCVDCHIPPMILQPYIENAIRHGIGLRQDRIGELLIDMEIKAGFLNCTVQDNGVGYTAAEGNNRGGAMAYQSIGMTLVAKRVEMLNKISDSPVLVTITDLEDHSGLPAGTKIILRFPMNMELQ